MEKGATKAQGTVRGPGSVGVECCPGRVCGLGFGRWLVLGAGECGAVAPPLAESTDECGWIALLGWARMIERCGLDWTGGPIRRSNWTIKQSLDDFFFLAISRWWVAEPPPNRHNPNFATHSVP